MKCPKCQAENPETRKFCRLWRRSLGAEEEKQEHVVAVNIPCSLLRVDYILVFGEPE